MICPKQHLLKDNQKGDISSNSTTQLRSVHIPSLHLSPPLLTPLNTTGLKHRAIVADLTTYMLFRKWTIIPFYAICNSSVSLT